MLSFLWVMWEYGDDMGKEGFHNVFGDRPIKWPIAKKKHIKTFTHNSINVNLQKRMIIKGVW